MDAHKATLLFYEEKDEANNRNKIAQSGDNIRLHTYRASAGRSGIRRRRHPIAAHRVRRLAGLHKGCPAVAAEYTRYTELVAPVPGSDPNS